LSGDANHREPRHLTLPRHFERSEAIQNFNSNRLDCFVASARRNDDLCRRFQLLGVLAMEAGSAQALTALQPLEPAIGISRLVGPVLIETTSSCVSPLAIDQT
jgi:hypothetical protein